MHEVRWLASPRQGELTHTRSVCVGVAETGGIDTYAERVCRRRRDRREKQKTKNKKQKQKQNQKQKQKAKAKAKATDFFMMPEGKALPFAAKS